VIRFTRSHRSWILSSGDEEIKEIETFLPYASRKKEKKKKRKNGMKEKKKVNALRPWCCEAGHI
jgi:hypothetical protein